MAIIEVKQLGKTISFDETKSTILNNIHLSVHEGEFVCIMGKSGSGKTTLLQLLGGLDTPTTGTITVGGENISALPEKKLSLFRRDQVGFIFQQYHLIPTLTAVENVALPLLLAKRSYKEATERAVAFLAAMGLAGKEDSYPSQLSGGQQQRVAIARAFANEPQFILADEPTGALDTENSQHIIALLRQACEQFQRTAVVVTHDPTVAVYADRIVFLQDGQIVGEVKGSDNTAESKRAVIAEIQAFMNAGVTNDALVR